VPNNFGGRDGWSETSTWQVWQAEHRDQLKTFALTNLAAWVSITQESGFHFVLLDYHTIHNYIPKVTNTQFPNLNLEVNKITTVLGI